MAATDTLLTWGGLPSNMWIPDQEREQESIKRLTQQLQAMAWAAQAKDAALLDLQKRLQAALVELEQSQAREAALLRRAEVAEAAEEALASQIGEVEAEAYASITENKKLVASLKGRDMEASRVEELQRRLQAAEEEAAGWERRCKELETEVAQGRVRETVLLKRLQTAEAAEEALASQMTELEAEAYTSITQCNSLATMKLDSEKQGELHLAKVEKARGDRQVAELQWRLTEAERALEAVEAKLRQAEERERRWGVNAAVKQVTVKRKGEAEQMPISLSLQELAGMVKLRLWAPSSLALTSAT